MKNLSLKLNPAIWVALTTSCFAGQPVLAGTDTWTGGGGNANWSNPANWLAGVAPSPYDSLVFTNQSGTGITANNDFSAGTAFDGITFGSSAANSPFTLTGNSILLSGNTNGITVGVNNTAALSETVNNNLALDWGYHTFYSPAGGTSLNLNGSLMANLGAVADFGTTNVASTSYTLDGTGLIAGLGGAGLVGNSELGGGFSALATIVNGVVTNYNYGAAQVIATGAIGVDATTTLTTPFSAETSGLAQETTTLVTGFTSGSMVSSVVVASATGISVGQFFTGTGVPGGVTVASVSGTTIGLTSFTSTAASAGNYIFSTGFGTGTTVTTLVVTNATGITVGQGVTGTGVPAGVTVTSVSGTTIGVSSFIATANNGTGNYTFGNIVTSLVVASATGIQVGDPVTGTGVPSGVTVAGIVGNTVSVSSFIATANSSGSYVFATGPAGTPQNLELTATTALNYSLAGGTSTTYGSNNTFINTILLTNNTATKVVIGAANGGTLVLGSTNAGSGMYVGGIYLPNASTGQGITIGDGNAMSITCGPMSGNPVPGEIIIGVNGNNTSNEGEMNAAIKNNLSGGPVSVVYTGGGSEYVNVTNSYTGGAYIVKGRVQCNNLTALGLGSVFIAGGDAEVSMQNMGVGTNINNWYLSPASSYVGATTEGSLRLNGTGGGNTILAGTVTLMGNPVTPPASAAGNPAVANRISASTAADQTIFGGQITGSGTLELYANASGIIFNMSNVTANANNWTGGLIIDSANNDNSDLKLWANNQLAGNNLTLLQAGTGYARLDLNGNNDAIGGLSDNGNALNQVINLGTTPSVLTIGTGNATSTFGGTIGGDSAPNTLSITKIGTGTLTLDNANTYTGNTLVLGGTLALAGTGSTGSSPEILVNNATFDVSAAVGFSGNGAAMGFNNSSFNLGNLTVSGVASLDLTNTTLSLAFNQSTANIAVSGALAFGGATNNLNISSVPGFGSYPQQFHVIQYGSFADVNGDNGLTNLGVILPAQEGFVGYLTNNTANNAIDLVISTGPDFPAEPVTWRGETNGISIGNWDIFQTSNWVQTANGTTPYYYEDTAPVTFDDSVIGTTTVVLKQAVLPGGITMNNNNSNYVFTGAGRISGTTGLTNNGTGTLILKETGGDNFSGGVTVNSGTVVFDNLNSSITGGVTINAGTAQVGNNDGNGSLPTGTLTDNGTLTFSRTDSALNLATVIAGTGGVANNGSGTVTLSAVETVTGPVAVNKGTLALAGGNSANSGFYQSQGITVNSGATLQVNIDNSLFGNGTLGAPVTINAGGTMTGLGTADAGTGPSSHVQGALTLNGGTLAMGGTSINAANGSWDLQGVPAVTVPGSTNTSIISALDVVPEQAGGTYFYVTNGATASGIDLLVSGTLINGTGQHDSGIIVSGTGVMVLDNNNTYSHGTTVSGATLQLGLSSDAAALTSPLGVGAATNTVSLNTSGVLKLASSKGVTIGNPISDDGTGTLLVASGTNILTGINTYSGPTIVKAGVLLLQSSATINGSSSIAVSNATFDVSQGGTITSSGSLSLTNSSFNLGTNLITSMNALTINNAKLTFALSVNPASMNLSGAFATAGTNLINITAVPGFPVFPTNIALIKYSSFVDVNANNSLTNLSLSLPTLGSPVGYLTNDVANSSIDLVVLSDTLVPIFPLTWNGQTNGVNNGNWNILTTSNWVITGTSTPYGYQDTTPVTFDDTAAGTTTVNLTTTVSPGSLTVSNASKTYTFGGTGKISGNTGLVMANSGTATFTESGGDNFTGGVTVNAGTLILADTNVSISGGMTMNGGELTDKHSGTITGDLDINAGSVLLDQTGSINGNLNINAGSAQVGNNDAGGNLPSGVLTDNSVLVFDRSDSLLNVAGVIAGNGSLLNNGPGMVTLSATETLTGPVVVNNGMLIMNAGNNAAPNGISRASSLTINNGGAVGVLVDNSLAGHGAAFGTLPITINAGGMLTGAPGADGGLGTSTHVPGTITLNGGTLANSGTSINAANGSWDLDGGVATAGGPITSIMSALDMAPSEAGGTTFNIIAGTTTSGIDLDVTGTIIHTTSQADTGIIQTGNGTMAFDNNNTYTGGTTINGGTLQLGTSTDGALLTSPLGTGPVSLNNPGSVLKFASDAGVEVNNVISDDNNKDTLVVVASGMNSLTAADTYTGNTLVLGGTLALTGAGSINDSAAIIVSNATFDISASSAAVASSAPLILTNSTFNLGTNVVTSLGSLAISNSTLTLVADTNIPNISLTGVLATGGTTNVINVTSVPMLPAYPTNVTLIKYTTADPNLVNGNNNLAKLGLRMSGNGYLTNNVGNSSIDLVVVSGVSTNAATADFQAISSAGSLQFSWAPDHLGWQLYTNSVGLTATGSWYPVSGSASVTNETIHINPANPNVFFQLRYP